MKTANTKAKGTSARTARTAKRVRGNLAPGSRARGLDAAEVAIGMDSAEIAEVVALVRAAGTSFYRGMRVLPPDRRHAIHPIAFRNPWRTPDRRSPVDRMDR